jgi:predicted dehydrogenase
MEEIKVGVIGLGEVAQLMHLPILRDMAGKFRIAAVSDPSPSLRAYAGERYQAAACPEPREVIHRADAVFVLCPDQYHGEYAEEAIRAGKPVFVEKPVTLCLEDLDRLIALRESPSPGVVMVGYMRRYAEPFLKAKAILAREPRRTEYLRVRDIICEGPFYIRQSRPVFRPRDLPEAILEEGRKRRREQVDRAIGPGAAEAQRSAYQMLTGLGCHSLAAVRELCGLPRRIRSVVTDPQGLHLAAVFEYDGFIGVYEMVNDQRVVQFDAAIEIFQGDRKLLLKYETPYIRNQPLSLEVTTSTEEDSETVCYGPSYRDPFRTELEEFYACIVEGRQPKTTLEDARQDLLLFREMIQSMGG